MSTTATKESATATKDEAARAVERLRVAEARLSRRRQTQCGPSETARAAMRFIYDSADESRPITPTDIAEHVGVSTASMAGILHGLRQGGLVTFTKNPDDGRSKFVVPLDRNADLEDFDPLTTHIRRLAERLSAEDAAVLSHFLDQVTSAVERECR
ncbi:MarR family winged helix-turn-helix transcriptional regulator [Microbacterium sp. SLBN-146]|uniref:MarR family winged helix-turn-helix transcriptional regulator n=1 Tax=Microbacterium sp. SLBN-146 TaxID=2768457 RepID=UPI0011506E27|nr:MarR family transcriptional regulator [Microbacterium sp. SLBN-146]TQJ30776.1 DNA-binding MarR family transcriptional regulator [Microbacterium sp. SLBN-146]